MTDKPSLADELREWIADIEAQIETISHETALWNDELLCLRRALAVVEEIERAPDSSGCVNRYGTPDEVRCRDYGYECVGWAERLREMVK